MMLALTTISPAVPREHLSPDARAEARAYLRATIQETLILRPDKEALEQLVANIAALPADLQALWVETVRQCFVSDVPTEGDCGCGGPTRDGSRNTATITGRGGRVERCACGNYLIPWPELPFAPVSDNIQRLRTSVVRAGETREEVFAHRIAPLVIAATELIVIDRYLADAVLRGSPGFGWLLRKVWSLRAVDVTVLTRHQPGSTDAFSKIHESARRDSGAPGRLRVFQASDKKFRTCSHDRFISATVGSRSLGVAIGKGVSIFDGSVTDQNYACQYLSNDGSAKRIMLELGFVSNRVHWV
jgi:hypothetical protein